MNQKMLERVGMVVAMLQELATMDVAEMARWMASFRDNQGRDIPADVMKSMSKMMMDMPLDEMTMMMDYLRRLAQEITVCPMMTTAAAR